MLKCKQCGWDKPNVLFPTKKLAGGVVGYRSICKDCTNINQSGRRLAQAGEARVKRAEKQRAWVVANREVIRGLKAKYRLQAKVVKLSSVKHEAHVIAYYKHQGLEAKRKEREATMKHDAHVRLWKSDTARYYRWRQKHDPIYIVYQRVKGRANQFIARHKIAKCGAVEWSKILGYTSMDLVKHIEKQFTYGMSWENANEWHIDHIKPLRIYDNITSVHDAAFAELFGLDNLRPVWAEDNHDKYWSYDRYIPRHSES